MENKMKSDYKKEVAYFFLKILMGTESFARFQTFWALLDSVNSIMQYLFPFLIHL